MLLRNKLSVCKSLFSAILVLGLFGCSNDGERDAKPNKAKNAAAAKKTETDVSPFSANRNLVAPTLTAADPNAIEVVVIIDESLRTVKQCVATTGISNLEAYLPASPLATEVKTKLLPLWTYSIYLTKDYILKSLDAAIANDKCVLGISNLSILKGILDTKTTIAKTANIYLNSVPSAYTNYRNASSYSDISTLLTQEAASQVSNKTTVKVAVLGTGLNLNSEYSAYTSFKVNPELIGSNYIERNSTPQDDHFLGTGIASILASKGVVQSDVKGLVPDLVKIIPFRVLERGNLSNDDFAHVSLKKFIGGVQLALKNLLVKVNAAQISNAQATTVATFINNVSLKLNALEDEVKGVFTTAQIDQLVGISDGFLKSYDASIVLAAKIKDAKTVQKFADVKTYFTAIRLNKTNLNSEIVNYFSAQVHVKLEELRSAVSVLKSTVVSDADKTAILNSLDTGYLTPVAHVGYYILAMERIARQTLMPKGKKDIIIAKVEATRDELQKLNDELESLGLAAAEEDALLADIKANIALVNQELLNQAVLRIEKFANNNVADAIIRAVNAGADIIHLALYGETDGCDPILGEAIYQATRKNVVVVMPAGDDKLEVFAPDANYLSRNKTISPACWGPYFKGAITVGGYETKSRIDNNIKWTEFSNYGSAIEIAAPSTSIPIIGLENYASVWNGTLFAAPQVTSAVATLIAYHKNRKWNYYSPWLIEDLLLASSETVPSFNVANKALVVDGKILNFKNIKTGLDTYATKSEDDRKSFAGTPMLLQAVPMGPVSKDTLMLLAASSSVAANQKMQLKAVILKPGTTYQEDVTSKIKWSFDKPTALSISTEGVVTPLSTTNGRIIITANYTSADGLKKLSSSAGIIIMPQDVTEHVICRCNMHDICGVGATFLFAA